MWVAFGSMWHGYEVEGWENIPDEGPALLVYYHGAVPIDYYQLVGNCILKKRRVIHSVVDKFLFKVMPRISLPKSDLKFIIDTRKS